MLNGVKFLRLSKGLSQTELSALAGISQGRISELETGKIKANSRELKALSKILLDKGSKSDGRG